MTLSRWFARAPRVLLLALLLCDAAGAASVCSSDGKTPPHVLVERFLPDACQACWNRPTPAADRTAYAIDWIVPGRDSNAPLSAAAVPDALRRLASMGYSTDTPEPTFWKWRHQVAQAHIGHLRVAHGQAVNDYVGVSIAWTPTLPDARPLDAWLLLVEDLPPGTAGSPSRRHLVRAALSIERIAIGPAGWNDRRSMRIPAGADPARLRLIGWVADANGQILAAAASHCEP
jgi:hypothetical protein